MLADNTTTTLLEHAFTFCQKGLFEEAESAYNNILESSPGHPDALLMLGVILYQKGDTDEAINLFSSAIDNHPRPPNYFFSNLATAFNDQGKLHEALENFQQSVKLQPDSARCYAEIGNILLKLGKREDAIKYCNKALSLTPGNAEAYYYLGLISDAKEEPSKAVEFYNQAFQHSMGSAQLWFLLGNAFNLHNIKDKALDSYLQGLSYTRNKNHASPFRRQANKVLRGLCRSISGKVLSIGSGHDFDKEQLLYRQYFTNCHSYTRLDLDPQMHPDLLGDVQDMRAVISKENYDAVFSLCSLEHVQQTESAIAEIHRILMPEGFFIFGLPLNISFHAYPHDYYRFTERGIQELLANRFKILDLNPIGEKSIFKLDKRLKLHGEMPERAHLGYIGIAQKQYFYNICNESKTSKRSHR